MHRSLEKVLLCLLFCLNFVDGSKQHYDDLERLQNDLFANYSTNIIPQKEKTTAVKVKFDIALNQIIDLVSFSVSLNYANLIYKTGMA